MRETDRHRSLSVYEFKHMKEHIRIYVSILRSVMNSLLTSLTVGREFDPHLDLPYSAFTSN